MAMRKTGSFPLKLIAPELFRSINLQKEWGEAFKTKNAIPQAGLAVVGSMPKNIVQRFEEEYIKALNWYKNNPDEAGELVAQQIDFLSAQAVSDSIAHVQLDALSAQKSKADLEAFFTILHEIQPKLIGNKLPDEGFYYQ
jgi:NitT/TauT family transport system substrate-binding protein